ncbi:MAG TPA: LLM class F420-dependent oxidoreductase [Candidatus Acidoferrales bacterium]|nr:LLM class F420-dependent oxidoreductase [Candidatus Acidoferrales bacterium]
MKLALFGINFGPCADPAVAIRVAQAAEAAGLESLWTGEHVVLPDPQVPPSPSAPDTPFLDPAVSLAFIAGATQTIRLGTGIIILPQRNPVVLAKELASLDVVSNGRLIFGIGVGYLKPEFDAIGASFDHKGARTIDYLQAMLALWTKAKPEYEGRFARFSGIQAMPRPVQKPHPPIVIGGYTPEAFRRAVGYANGWYGFAQDVDATARCLDGLREAGTKVERPEVLGDLEISITPAAKLDADTVKRYADLGVDRLIVSRRATNPSEALQAVDRIHALAAS